MSQRLAFILLLEHLISDVAQHHWWPSKPFEPLSVYWWNVWWVEAIPESPDSTQHRAFVCLRHLVELIASIDLISSHELAYKKSWEMAGIENREFCLWVVIVPALQPLPSSDK